jgi:hypothetical protein
MRSKSGIRLSGSNGRRCIEPREVAVDLLGAGKLGAQRADDHHRELKPLRLVDCHHLDVALGEGLVRVLVFVDAAVVEQAQKAVEEVEPQELAIAMRDNGVVVVALEDVEQL